MPKLAKKTSNTSNKSDPGKKKPSAISKAPKGKQSAKTTTNKKAALQPKRSGSIKESKASNERTLDLCLLLDCTSSMHSWIQRSKDTLKTIID